MTEQERTGLMLSLLLRPVRLRAPDGRLYQLTGFDVVGRALLSRTDIPATEAWAVGDLTGFTLAAAEGRPTEGRG